jgi:NTP pyrophosphatase (non-canonical NTP hydrolase)
MRLMRLVRSFAEKHGFTLDRRIESVPPNHRVDSLLLDMAADLRGMAVELRSRQDNDLRAARCDLMLEELGETIEALAKRDLIELADGVADLAYVVAGTAAAFGLPLDGLIDEVHASNMSKDAATGHKPRKGDDFFEPNIRRVLESARLLVEQPHED